MVSDEKQYEFVTSQIAAQIERIVAGFKLFIQLFSAVVGGTVWLKLQIKEPIPAGYIWLSDALVSLITVTTFLMVLMNLLSWFGYRRAQCDLVGKNKVGSYIVPLPKWKSSLTELAMMFTMVAAMILFWCFNPLAQAALQHQ
jgi:hypothetical protein